MLRNARIQRKLMAVNLTTSAAVVLLVTGFFLIYEYLEFKRTDLERLSTMGKVIAANSTGAVIFQNQRDAAEILLALQAYPHLNSAVLYDATGNVIAQYPASPARKPLLPGQWRDGYRFNDDYLTGYQPIIEDGKRIGTLFLQSDLGAMYARFRMYGGLAVVILLGALVLAYLFSKLLQRQISRPVLALAETARAIAERGDYSVRATKLSNDEIGLLTDAFNQMLWRIQELNATLEQRVIERTLQLEAANKELEAFSYSVSHDLRAPLRHISGFAEIMTLDYAPKLDDTGKRYLNLISKAAQQMGSLVDDLLVFSRMGRAELQYTQVKMQEVVDQAIQELKQDWKDRAIQWDISPLPDVAGDQSMLKQVWLNLISNAVKYTRQREKAFIIIRARKMTREWEFSIADNGAGFDMAYADKLFGVFQRLHQPEQFEGTGIGLANVRRIIQRHGGRTWGEGILDGGATFYFSLPDKDKSHETEIFFKKPIELTNPDKHESAPSHPAGGR